MTAILNFVPPKLDVSPNGPGSAGPGAPRRGASAFDSGPDRIAGNGGPGGGSEFARMMESRPARNETGKNDTVKNTTVKNETADKEPDYKNLSDSGDAITDKAGKTAPSNSPESGPADKLAVTIATGPTQVSGPSALQSDGILSGAAPQSNTTQQSAVNVASLELAAVTSENAPKSMTLGGVSGKDSGSGELTSTALSGPTKADGLQPAVGDQPSNSASRASQSPLQSSSGNQDSVSSQIKVGNATDTAPGTGFSRPDTAIAVQPQPGSQQETPRSLETPRTAAAGGESMTALRGDPTAQARQAAPIQSERLPTSISLNAERDTGLTGGAIAADQAAGLDSKSRPLNGSTAGQRAGQHATDSDSTGPDRRGISMPPTGKDLPDSGKLLPANLAQTPAVNAPGLADRIEQMIRATGSDRRRLGKGLEETGRIRSTGDAPGEIPGLERAAISQNRVPGTEFFSKVFAQANAGAAGGNIDLAQSQQSSGSDSQATSLLAQSLAGADKASAGRALAAAGMENGSNLTLNLQQASQELGNQLSNRIRWMSNLNISSAELRLHPAELGTLEILISSEDDQTRVNFITSNAAAKEIIEGSMPRLRELLGQSGLLLEQGDVSHRDLERNGSGGQSAGHGSQLSETRETDAGEQQPAGYQRATSEHQIDHFA